MAAKPRPLQKAGAIRRFSMKIITLFAIAIAMTTVGCVGPRTGSVGHRYVPQVLTTNLSGTVTSQQVGDQPPVTFAQTNFTVVSTPPVQERTWREKVLGQRPPGQSTVMPPFPNAGVYGVNMSAAPHGTAQGRTALPQRTSGPRYGIGPTGAKYLLPGRYGGISRFRSGRVVSGRTRTYAAVRATVYTHGRVNIPMTGFERSARGHAVSIGTLPRRGYVPYGTVVVKTRQIQIRAVGGGMVVSGLARRR